MSPEPRIWTLNREPREVAGEWVVGGDHQAQWYRGGESVLVVEAQPVAELLERIEPKAWKLSVGLEAEVKALLAALRKHESRPS